MAVAVDQYALTDLERVKEHGGLSGTSDDQELVRLINETSARIEAYLGRNVVTRTYTHDGSTLPRLDSNGGSTLILKHFPVTNVASLKLDPDATALTEGWNQDFVVNQDKGWLDLVGGGVFLSRSAVVECTYTGGYATTDPTYKELQYAATKQVVWAFRQKDREREGVASRSDQGVTVSYLTDAWLPEVREILDRHAHVRVG